MIYRYLTPEQRAVTERAMTAHLAATYGPEYRVCLHPDRTSARLPGGGYRIECDYCPASVEIFPGDEWPDIEPRYYEDREPHVISTRVRACRAAGPASEAGHGTP